jgi:hypothetical protein
MAPVLR